MTPADSSGLRERLQSRLREAMKARDVTTIAVMRSVLGTIGNAEAVDAGEHSTSTIGGGPIAGAVEGIGAAEVARRELTESDVEAIVRREIADRVAAADEYERLGRTNEAAELRAQCDALQTAID